MHHSTRGGSSDTEVKLLTVIPIWDVSAEPAVMTAIPVGKKPSASRNPLVSKSISHPGLPPLHTRLRGGMHDRSKVRRRGEKTARPDRVIKGGGHGRRQHGRYQADKKGRACRASWRRLEGRLCGLRDRDDGLLSADVADQYHHAGAETRHRRLFRAPVHRPDRI